MADAAVVEETVKKLSTQKGVIGVIIVNADGVPVRSTLDRDVTTQYAALTAQMTRQAVRMVRDIAPDDELQYFRLRSKKYEIIVAPCYEQDQKLVMVVIQDPTVTT
jgi:dynein light chain roadblock-type